MFSGIFFIFVRLLQIVTLIPTVGMLAWFIHGYVAQNALTPDYILIVFVTSVLGAAWCLGTLLAYPRARYSAGFISIVDLAFFATFVVAVYKLRTISNIDCQSFEESAFYIALGVVGAPGLQLNTEWSGHPTKTCSMLKACYAFGIVNCIFFFFTSLFAFFIRRHYRDDKPVVRRTTHVSRHSHRPRTQAHNYPRGTRHSRQSRYV